VEGGGSGGGSGDGTLGVWRVAVRVVVLWRVVGGGGGGGV